MAERLTRKQLKEDRFVDLVAQGVDYARENTVVVVIAAVVFIGAVAAAIQIGGQAAGAGAETDSPGAQALSQARQAFLGGNLEAGASALEQVRADHARSDAGREATYILGNTYLQLGDYTKAEETYREFLAKPLHDDLMVDGAKLGIAAAKEEAGDLSGAAAEYRQVWESGVTPGARIQGAMSSARLLATLGQSAAAKELLQAIVDTYPATPAAEQAEFRLMSL